MKCLLIVSSLNEDKVLGVRFFINDQDRKLFKGEVVKFSIEMEGDNHDLLGLLIQKAKEKASALGISQTSVAGW